MDEHLESHQNAPVAQPNTMYVGSGNDGQVQVAADSQDDGVITWEASEFASYDKSSGWFMLYLLGGVSLSVIMYLLVDLISAIVVLLLSVSMLIYGKMKPKDIRYTVSDVGVSIGEKGFYFSDLKSFSVMSHEGINSIYLTPLHRLTVPITMYLPPENQDQVLQILADHLPNEQKEPDFMDKITSKLRF